MVEVRIGEIADIGGTHLEAAKAPYASGALALCEIGRAWSTNRLRWPNRARGAGNCALVVQRGTNRAWANRSGKPCRMLFVLIDGKFDPPIAPSMDWPIPRDRDLGTGSATSSPA